MTIADLLKQYAKKSHVSVVNIERRMGWRVDTIRKMTLATDKNIARVRSIADVFPDLYDRVPELRFVIGDNANVRDVRVEGLEALVQQQKETIEALRGEVELLKELLNSKR